MVLKKSNFSMSRISRSPYYLGHILFLPKAGSAGDIPKLLNLLCRPCSNTVLRLLCWEGIFVASQSAVNKSYHIEEVMFVVSQNPANIPYCIDWHRMHERFFSKIHWFYIQMLKMENYRPWLIIPSRNSFFLFQNHPT